MNVKRMLGEVRGEQTRLHKIEQLLKEMGTPADVPAPIKSRGRPSRARQIKQATRPRNVAKRVLAYLTTPHTAAEIARHLGYKTPAPVYAQLRALVKTKKVVKDGKTYRVA